MSNETPSTAEIDSIIKELENGQADRTMKLRAIGEHIRSQEEKIAKLVEELAKLKPKKKVWEPCSICGFAGTVSDAHQSHRNQGR
jgi:chromosome segregation and condensation protein ScpB